MKIKIKSIVSDLDNIKILNMVLIFNLFLMLHNIKMD